MPLRPAALETALAKPPAGSTTPAATAAADTVEAGYSALCRREAPAFQRAACSGEPLLVACTQEARLFLELAEQTEGAPPLAERPIRFVNIRETAGWSREAGEAMPKIAALIAAAQRDEPAPVPGVTFRSQGRCLLIGPGERAEPAAARLEAGGLVVSILATAGTTELAQAHERAVHRGRLLRLTGHLGAFEASWETHNPIDLDLCTRCNACIAACPEGAIDLGYAIDLDRCRRHRACLAACESAGAIDFGRAAQRTDETFDLVIDLRDAPAFTQHQPPQGYWHVGRDERRLAEALAEARERVGEFEKPRFFAYTPRLCAHSRNETIGCRACLDVCSTSAIRSAASLKGKAAPVPRGTTPVAPVAGGQGGGVIVDPYLCAGCGACSTVCPSGALAFAAPGAGEQSRRLRTLLQTYRAAGGRDAALLIHGSGAGQRWLDELGRAASIDRQTHGLPARVIPLPVWHTASIGMDLWLLAIAGGANQVWVLLTPDDAEPYRQALAEQMAQAQAILSGLGFAGEHLRLLELRDARDLPALDAALRVPPAQGVARPASLVAQADKRATLELALDALMAAAPAVPEAIELPAAGSPFGTVVVDDAACTLCLSCVGACPAAALADNPDLPQLRFIEKNCVQCGLCVKTCPENAIRLHPRLWLADQGRARKQARVVQQAEPFHCIGCGKPFGTARAIEAMIARIGAHPAFAGANAQRLRMCGDCRVNAMFSNPGETRITDL